MLFLWTVFKLILWVVLGIITTYSLLALLGTFIPANRKFIPKSQGVDLYLSTNGMHTDFVLPTCNELFDWTQYVDEKCFKTTLNSSTYLGIGWGDKSIYLDIAEWSELTLKMGLATLFLPTPSILHVTAYETPPNEAMKVSKTRISNSQYLQLCHFILGYFEVNANQKIQLIEGVGYTENDNFYRAKGKYHALATCNSWVSKGLKKIGVRAPLWTPFDKGIFYQFDKVLV